MDPRTRLAVAGGAVAFAALAVFGVVLLRDDAHDTGGTREGVAEIARGIEDPPGAVAATGCTPGSQRCMHVDATVDDTTKALRRSLVDITRRRPAQRCGPRPGPPPNPRLCTLDVIAGGGHEVVIAVVEDGSGSRYEIGSG